MQRLPNYQNAVIDPRKLTEYALNPDHPSGGHKARRLLAATGLGLSDVEKIRAEIQAALGRYRAVEGNQIYWGRVFVVDFPLTGAIGVAVVRTSWIIEGEGEPPRMTSFYVKES